ncbi:unnamed protein product [Ixodes pacificus]
MRWAGTVEKVRSRLARMPGGGSNRNTRPARSRLTGTLGCTSRVRKSRKDGWGCRACSFFSSCTSHCGARCTFFSITHLRGGGTGSALLMAFSAWLKPSAEPMARDVMLRPRSVARSSTRPLAS